MVCGTTSSAGKSFLVTALARWYARAGYRVAPFKAQNMSNNARVVADGEIGSAQYFQALAARCMPEVRMNPVLLKPETDSRSQVVLLGRRNARLTAMEWRERAALLWPTVRGCLEELMLEYEVLIIEGAGSAAEINLQATDIVNMRVAEAAGAATLLICDIDRGGAFAHLYGTYRLLSESHRALIRGFVLNRFRGDQRLLAPGPQMLEPLTGVPTIGVLPLWRDHGLPEEDGIFDAPSPGAGTTVVIVAYPHISNLDEFAPLRRVPGISLIWARHTQSIAHADLLILPGSKHVAADIAWLRASGIDAAIRRHAEAGKPVLAICGGLQMLGTAITDPHGVEGSSTGLGLLPVTTEFQARKRHHRDRYTFRRLTGYWAPLSGVRFDAYEIRHGRTWRLPHAAPAVALATALPDDAGYQCGAILGLYTHGMFEDAGVLRAVFGAEVPSLDDTFDGLANFIDKHLAVGVLGTLLQS